jgi:hypothetical protein
MSSFPHSQRLVGDDIHELSNKVNAEINKMAVWFRVNKLAVNINKTKYMVFRMKGKKLIICLIFYIMKMNL